jgi:hypothetical protein
MLSRQNGWKVFCTDWKHSHKASQQDIVSKHVSIGRALKARDVSAMGTVHGYDNRKYSGFWQD